MNASLALLFSSLIKASKTTTLLGLLERSKE